MIPAPRIQYIHKIRKIKFPHFNTIVSMRKKKSVKKIKIQATKAQISPPTVAFHLLL